MVWLKLLKLSFVGWYSSWIGIYDGKHALVSCATQNKSYLILSYLMMSSNGNIFRVTGHLCGEFTGDRGIPGTKASDAEHWCFLWSAWMDGWVNNHEAGDLRRHRAHYDVTVMILLQHRCGDVTWPSYHIRSPTTWLFVQQLYRANKQRKHQSSSLRVFVRRMHRWLMDSPKKDN